MIDYAVALDAVVVPSVLLGFSLPFSIFVISKFRPKKGY